VWVVQFGIPQSLRSFNTGGIVELLRSSVLSDCTVCSPSCAFGLHGVITCSSPTAIGRVPIAHRISDNRISNRRCECHNPVRDLISVERWHSRCSQRMPSGMLPFVVRLRCRRVGTHAPARCRRLKPAVNKVSSLRDVCGAHRISHIG
jgi:hypothetical protein